MTTPTSPTPPSAACPECGSIVNVDANDCLFWHSKPDASGLCGASGLSTTAVPTPPHAAETQTAPPPTRTMNDTALNIEGGNAVRSLTKRELTKLRGDAMRLCEAINQLKVSHES